MARFTMTLLALPMLALARAQYGYGSSSTGAKTTNMAAATSTSTSSSGAVHSISVGQGGQLKFSPDSITAKVGDLVEFSFVGAGHSVALGDFSSPCKPKDSSAFFSGFPVDTGKTFTITVNSTDPMWFYCTAPSHCQAGMVGVINAPSGETVNEYAKAAGKTSKSNAPAQMQGGTFAAVKNPSGSTATTGMTGTTGTATGAASSGASSSSSSTGAAPTQLVLGSLGAGLPLGILGYMLL